MLRRGGSSCRRGVVFVLLFGFGLSQNVRTTALTPGKKKKVKKPLPAPFRRAPISFKK